MYRRNIYFYFFNSQMRRNIHSRCPRFRNHSTILDGNKDQGIKSRQTNLLNREQNNNTQLLNQNIEQWRSSRHDNTNLAKIVKIPVIKKDELLIRKILSLIFRNNNRCHRRLSLKEVYEKPRKEIRKRFLHNSLKNLIALLSNSKFFRVIVWSQIDEISRKISIGKRFFRRSVKPQLKCYIAKYKRRIPTFKSYFAIRSNTSQNSYRKKKIKNSRFQEDNTINKSILNQEKIKPESRSTPNFSILPSQYKFAGADMKKLESLMTSYFTKLQEGIPKISNYLSKFSRSSSRNETALGVDCNKTFVHNKNESLISGQEDNTSIKKNYVSEDTEENKVMLLQSRVQGFVREEPLNEMQSLQSILRNDIKEIEKLLSAQRKFVNLDKSISKNEGEFDKQFNDKLKNYVNLKKTIFEIEVIDKYLTEISTFHTHMNNEADRKSAGDQLKDNSINVEKCDNISIGFRNSADGINNYAHKDFNENRLSNEFIDNALMLSTQTNPENVQIVKNSDSLLKNSSNNKDSILVEENSQMESIEKQIFSEFPLANSGTSTILDKIDTSSSNGIERKLETDGLNSKNSNGIFDKSPICDTAELKSQAILNTFLKWRGDSETAFEIPEKKITSDYLRINEDKQFSKFTSKFCKKHENTSKIDSELEKIVRGNKIDSRSDKVRPYFEFETNQRDFDKRSSVCRVLECVTLPSDLKPTGVIRWNHHKSYSNELKNNSPQMKRIPTELEKNISVDNMSIFGPSSNETSKYQKSPNILQEIETQTHSKNGNVLDINPKTNESEVVTVPNLKENEGVILKVLTTNSELTKLENQNLVDYQAVSKDAEKIHKESLLEFYSSLQNEHKNTAVVSKNSQPNTERNHQMSYEMNENSNKNTEILYDLQPPVDESYLISNNLNDAQTKPQNNEGVSSYKNSEQKTDMFSYNFQCTKYDKNEFDGKCRFDFLPENIPTENAELGKQTAKYNTKEFDEKCRYDLKPYLETTPHKNEEIVAESTEHKIIQDSKCYEKDFDKKSRFEILSEFEVHPTTKEKNLIEMTQHSNSSRKFGDLVLKVEEMKINSYGQTQPTEILSSKNKLYNLNTELLDKELAGGDGIQDESNKKHSQIHGEPNNNKFGILDVAKEILTHNIKREFNDKISNMLYSSENPTITYHDVHQNLKEPLPKSMNIDQELHRKEMGINDGKARESKNKELDFDESPIKFRSHLQINNNMAKNKTQENDRKINLDEFSTNNLEKGMKKDLHIGFERRSKNRDFLADVMNYKIADSNLLVRHFAEKLTNFECKRKEVDEKKTSSFTRNEKHNETSFGTPWIRKSEQEIVKNISNGRFSGDNEVTDEISKNNRVEMKFCDVSKIERSRQSCLNDNKINLSEIYKKSSDTLRSAALEKSRGDFPVDSHNKSLSIEEIKSSDEGMKTPWILTAGGGPKFDGTFLNSFEESQKGGGDMAYGNLFDKGAMNSKKETKGAILTDEQLANPQEKISLKKNHQNRMPFLIGINSDILKKFPNEKEMIRNDDNRAVLKKDLPAKKQNKEYNERGLTGHAISDFRTLNFLDSKVGEHTTGLSSSENAAGDNSPPIENAVKHGSFNGNLHDAADDYEFICSKILVNSKTNGGQVHEQNPDDILVKTKLGKGEKNDDQNRVFETQGLANEKDRDKTDSRDKGYAEKHRKKTTKVTNRREHENNELENLERLHKVLNELGGIVDSLFEKSDINFHGEESNAEQKSMLRDINDSLIRSLALLHVFKEKYDKLELKYQQSSKTCKGRSKAGQKHSSKEEHRKIDFLGGKLSSIKNMVESSNKDDCTGMFEYAMEENYSKVDDHLLSSNNINSRSRLYDWKLARKNRIPNRFYKYNHLLKIEEEEFDPSEEQQTKLKHEKLSTNYNTSDPNMPSDVQCDSNALAGTSKHEVGPENIRKKLMHICSKYLVNEMLHKTEIKSDKLYLKKEYGRNRYSACDKNNFPMANKTLYTD